MRAYTLTTEKKARKNLSQGKKNLSQGKKNLSQVKKNLSHSTVYILPKTPTHYKTLTNTHITKPTHTHTCAHTHLQLRKKHGKTSVRVRKTSVRVRKTSVRLRKTSVTVQYTYYQKHPHITKPSQTHTLQNPLIHTHARIHTYN